MSEQENNMNDQTTPAALDKVSFRDKHSFLLFISFSIFIASVVVAISMSMYNGSGAAQLDLSRPGYKSVRSQVTAADIDYKNFSGTGKIDKGIISDFKSLYAEQVQRVKIVDAFGGDPLSADALGISAPSEL